VCVWTKGAKFADPCYVERLAQSVHRHLRGPYRFVVLRPKETSYWAKISLFKDGLFPPGARVLYLDLDSIIVGSLDFVRDIALGADQLHMVPSLSYAPHKWNSACLLWRANTLGYLADVYTESDKHKYPNGDQQYLYANAHQVASFDRGLFLSYKRDIRPTQEVPKDARVIMFHGYPMPHEVDQPWVHEHWGPAGAAALSSCKGAL